MTIGTALAATTPPPASAQSPYPDISAFKNFAGHLGQFNIIDRYGLWFQTPLGLNCAIGDDGSYGCSGGLNTPPTPGLPGTRNGENEVGWFPGDSSPRIYHADELKFNSGEGQTILIPEWIVAYRGSKCAVTLEGALYCINGDNANTQIMVTRNMTYTGSQALPSS